MMIAALNGLVDKYRLQGAHIDEVVGGAVVTHSRISIWRARPCSAPSSHPRRPGSP